MIYEIIINKMFDLSIEIMMYEMITDVRVKISHTHHFRGSFEGIYGLVPLSWSVFVSDIQSFVTLTNRTIYNIK